MNNNKGFSLIEVMITIGISMAKALIFTQMMANQNKATQKSRLSSNRDLIFNQLASAAQSPDALIISSWDTTNNPSINNCINPFATLTNPPLILATLSASQCPESSTAKTIPVQNSSSYKAFYINSPSYMNPLLTCSSSSVSCTPTGTQCDCFPPPSISNSKWGYHAGVRACVLSLINDAPPPSCPPSQDSPIAFYDRRGQLIAGSSQLTGSLPSVGYDSFGNKCQTATSNNCPLLATSTFTVAGKTAHVGVKLQGNGTQNTSLRAVDNLTPYSTISLPPQESPTSIIPANNLNAADKQPCRTEGYAVQDINGIFVCRDGIWMQMPSKISGQCSAFGGTVAGTYNGASYCRLPGSSCPSGWNFTGFNTTSNKHCSSSGTTGCKSSSCDTGEHKWGDVLSTVEQCNYRSYTACGPDHSTKTCSANVTEVGCAPTR